LVWLARQPHSETLNLSRSTGLPSLLSNIAGLVIFQGPSIREIGCSDGLIHHDFDIFLEELVAKGESEPSSKLHILNIQSTIERDIVRHLPSKQCVQTLDRITESLGTQLPYVYMLRSINDDDIFSDNVVWWGSAAHIDFLFHAFSGPQLEQDLRDMKAAFDRIFLQLDYNFVGMALLYQ